MASRPGEAADLGPRDQLDLAFIDFSYTADDLGIPGRLDSLVDFLVDFLVDVLVDVLVEAVDERPGQRSPDLRRKV